MCLATRYTGRKSQEFYSYDSLCFSPAQRQLLTILISILGGGGRGCVGDIYLKIDELHIINIRKMAPWEQ